MSQGRSDLHYALIANFTAILQRCNNDEQSHDQSSIAVTISFTLLSHTP